LWPSDQVAAALSASSAASSFASGVFYTVSALYLVRVAGLEVAEVGLGLTLAGATGVAASLAAGYVADRVGAARVLLVSTTVHGLALLAYATVTTFTAFLPVAALAVATRAAGSTARAVVIAEAFAGAERVLVRARLGVLINVFIGVGTVTAGLALLVDTSVAYTVALLGAGLFVLVSARPLLALPRLLNERTGDVPGGSSAKHLAGPDEPRIGPGSSERPKAPGRNADKQRRSPLRAPRYVVVSILGAVLAMHAGLLTVGVPMWIATRTDAPPVMVSVLLLLNTVLVVAVQVHVAKRVRDARSGARAAAASGALLAIACPLYATAAWDVATATVVLLLICAATVHSLGEVAAEVGSWALAYDLAPSDSVGAYQGVHQMSVSAGAMFAPLVVTATALEHSTPGWIGLAAIFALAGLATPALLPRNPHRRRPVRAAATEVEAR
jgi:predicted MFS family arabinose efflux permease